MEWKIFSMEWNGMKDFDGYKIWKISIPFRSIACPVAIYIFSIDYISKKCRPKLFVDHLYLSDQQTIPEQTMPLCLFFFDTQPIEKYTYKDNK